MTIFNHSNRANGFIKRLLGGALGTSTLGVALAFGSQAWLEKPAFAIEHNSASAPHRTIGCENGNCQPRPGTFGHYRPHWRPWPGLNVYQGFRKANEGVSTQQDWLPDARDETRFEPRTRSNRPLDPDPAANGALMDEAIPSSTDEADPNNPFNQTVPESDLPGPAQPGGAAPGGIGNGGLGGGFGDGAGFGGDAPPPPGNDNGAGDSLQDSLFPTDTPAEEPDGNLFESEELPNSDEEPLEGLFGQNSQRSPSDRDMLINIGPVRFIKNRPSPLNRAQLDKNSAKSATPIPVSVAQSMSGPKLGMVGHVEDESNVANLGGFGATDLVSPSKVAPATSSTSVQPSLQPQRITEIENNRGREPVETIDRVSHEAPIGEDVQIAAPTKPAPTTSAPTQVYEATGNPLRPRVVKSAKPVADAKAATAETAAKTTGVSPGPVVDQKLIPLTDVELVPIPTVSNPATASNPTMSKQVAGNETEDSQLEANLVDQIPALENELDAAHIQQSNGPTKGRLDASRTLIAMNKRSLRDTLRKNPLRR